MAFGHSRKDVEISSVDSESKHAHSNSSQAADVRLDKRGLPLVPQPTSDPLDPLNWNLWLKILVLLQVSLLAFLALFSASLIVSPQYDYQHSIGYQLIRAILDPGVSTPLQIPPQRPNRNRLCHLCLHRLRGRLLPLLEPNRKRLRPTAHLHNQHLCRNCNVRCLRRFQHIRRADCFSRPEWILRWCCARFGERNGNRLVL